MKTPWSDTDPAEKTAVSDSPTGPVTRGHSGVHRVPQPHWLELVQGPGAPLKVTLRGPAMVIGRGDQADYRIDSEELSRRHLLIMRDGDEYTAEDLDSRNGVYLNGVKIHSATLRDKDTIQLGGVLLVYHEGG